MVGHEEAGSGQQKRRAAFLPRRSVSVSPAAPLHACVHAKTRFLTVGGTELFPVEVWSSR